MQNNNLLTVTSPCAKVTSTTTLTCDNMDRVLPRTDRLGREEQFGPYDGINRAIGVCFSTTGSTLS